MTDETLIRELTAREKARRDALVNDDMVALADLMSEDLVHVHNTGIIHGKAELIGHASGFMRVIEIERGPLTIRRLCENAAVMTGTMTNTVKRRDVDERVVVRSFVTQVWVRQDGCWRIASFQGTRLPEPAAGS